MTSRLKRPQACIRLSRSFAKKGMERYHSSMSWSDFLQLQERQAGITL